MVLGGEVMVLIVPSGCLTVVGLAVLATVTENFTSPWKAASGWDSSPVAITPVA